MFEIFQTPISIDFYGEMPLYFGMGIKILCALFLGCLVGIDREAKAKSAGIKTNMLICLGATLYTIVSILNQKFSGSIADPSRITAQVVTGVGFLGAGAIIRGNAGVIGLTTAATIWMVAAIGVTIGSGYPLMATLVTVTTLLVLNCVQPIYAFLERHMDTKNYQVEILGHEHSKTGILHVLHAWIDKEPKIEEKIISDSKGTVLYMMEFSTYPKNIPKIESEFKSVVKVKEINTYLHQQTEKAS